MGDQAQKDAIVTMSKVVSNYMFSSDFYLIKNWSYDFGYDDEAAIGFNDCFCFVFVRKGKFMLNVSRRENHDMHSGHIIIEKPEYEYRVKPSYGECSIFNFSDDFYLQYLEDMSLKNSFFFANKNILSLVLKASPECEYLYYQLIQRVGFAGKLEMDNLVIELLNQVVNAITEISIKNIPDIITKPYHLTVVERAKEYINQKFSSDISLLEISQHSCVSLFHFSRVFKKITNFSPNQYLQNVRLKHGEMLLRNSSLPVTDIAFSSGFGTPEYFATVFRQKYGMSPTQYRES